MGLRALLLLWACPLAVTQESTEKEYVELDDVTWTTALLLISFVIVSTGVLCLVKCKDEDIRKESWALLNVTLSVFCAASFDTAVCRLIETFSEEEEHLKPAFMSKPILIIVLFVFLCLVFVVLHLAFLCLIPQENHHVLFATQVLGSHIMAFASIVSFGHLQMQAVSWQAVPSWGRVWLVPLLAFGVMVILYERVLHLLRRFEHKWWKEKRLAMHQAMLMQIDTGGISVGFLIVQALCYSLIDESEPASSDESEPERRFMPITHGYPGHHKAYTIPLLGLLALVLLCSSSVWFVCLRHMERHSEFFFEFIGILGSSMACWCLQRGGIIFFYQKCQSRMNPYLAEVMCKHPHECHGSHEMQPVQVVHRAVIVNALAMSLLAVVCMLVIDKVADFWQGKPCCPATHSTSYVAMAGPAGDLDVRTAKALRKVMSGLGLLVGICWDKAFESSYDTVLDPHTMSRLAFQHDTVNEIIQDHPKLAATMVAFVGFAVSVLVACAWFWHIVPSAMKEERDHEEAIELETQSLQNIKLPGEKTPTWQSSSSSEPDVGCWQTDAESD